MAKAESMGNPKGTTGLESTREQGLTPPVEPEAETDAYVMLQGPAHIILGANGTIEVAFLDDAGNRKQSIPFAPATDNTGVKALRVVFMDLLIEIDKGELASLTDGDRFRQGDKLTNYFPKVFHMVDETPINQPFMTSTGPPFNKAKV